MSRISKLFRCSCSRHLCLGLFLAVYILPLSAANMLVSDPQLLTVKAVLVERFSRFVGWPGEEGAPNAPFTVCVAGSREFTELIDKTYKEQKVRSKRVTVKTLDGLSEVEHCQVLFITHAKRKLLPKILKQTRYSPILTVGETDGFSQKGVLINFFFAESKMRFEINETAVKNSGLHMSYKLLAAARVVEPLPR